MTLPRALWASLFVASCLYLVMVLWSLPRIADGAGGLMPFDLRPTGYTVAEARTFLAALGSEDTAFYLGTQHWLDLAFPAALVVFLILAYIRLLPMRLAILCAIPALAGASFDYLENAAVAGLLRAGPEAATDAAIYAANRWTVMKSGASTIAYILLLLAAAFRLWQWVSRRRNG